MNRKAALQCMGMVCILCLSAIFGNAGGQGEDARRKNRTESVDGRVTDVRKPDGGADVPEDGSVKENTGAKNGMEAEKPRIAITFDDGPHPRWTPKLLEGLRARGVRATFFLIGANVEGKEDIVRQMYADGNIVGNHTYSHVEMTTLTDEEAQEEICRTNELITETIDAPVSFMRPPFGSWQKHLEQQMEVLPVGWSVDPLDWTTTNTDEIVSRVVTEVKENDIILLHDCYESSVNAAFRIIDLLQKEGYQFVTVEELILP